MLCLDRRLRDRRLQIVERGALLAADGTPIVLTDDKGTAISHAMGDELEIAHLH